MAQTMSMHSAKAGAPGGRGDNLGHSAGGESTMRSLDAYKYRAAIGARRTASAQIRRHRLADIRGQGETFGAVCLAAHHDLTNSPIDILQPKFGDFAGPHTEANQHGHYREVAAAVRGAVVAGGQKPLDQAGFQAFG